MVIQKKYVPSSPKNNYKLIFRLSLVVVCCAAFSCALALSIVRYFQENKQNSKNGKNLKLSNSRVLNREHQPFREIDCRQS